MAHPKITAAGFPVAAPTLQPWTCCCRPTGACTHPDQLASVTDWLLAEVPGTAAAALQSCGQWDLAKQYDFDADDWWFRTSFSSNGAPCRLRFEGLATLAEVWLNGQLLLSADNMFRTFQMDVTPHLRAQNELVIGFRSVAADLKKKRTRPRWKTNLVNNQQLRWLRTSLLGASLVGRLLLHLSAHGVASTWIRCRWR